MTTPPLFRATEAWLVAYRRLWRSTLFSSVVSPVLYLAAMGLGVGSLVSHGARAASLGGADYLSFVAPGLLAASAMQTAATEATWPVMASMKWVGTYKAMLASPLGPADIALGHLVWMTARLTLTSAVFTLVMIAFGATRSFLVILALPAAALTGAAFAAPIAAYSASLDRDTGLSGLMRFGIIPLFLFSGTFFPISQLPAGLRPIAYLTPLWHGVDLCRSLSLGTATAGRALLHAAYLAAWVVAGSAVAVARFRARLVP